MECTGERYLPDYDGDWTLEHMHRYLIAREYVHDKDVLDIASGEGYGSYMLSSVANSVIGVDISEEAILFASQKYKSDNLKFIKGEACNIPLEDCSIDIVVSFETIEHINNHQRMLEEIKRVLRKDGVLIISSPDKREYTDIPKFHNPYHIHELYRKEFEQLLKNNFNNYEIVGQRVVFGSVVGSENSSKFISWNKNNYKFISNGLINAEYLIAIASDLEIKRLPSSLLKCDITDSDVIKKFLNELKNEKNKIEYLTNQYDSIKSEYDKLKIEIRKINKNKMYKLSKSINKRISFLKDTTFSIINFFKDKKKRNNYCNIPYISYEEKSNLKVEIKDIKLVAFYLPQFHTFPENDDWWGKGFTEWTNVKRSYPLFKGHIQPEIPHKSIGYYNLLDTNIMHKQAELATNYGIYGFCFHYYWFSGKRLMEKPVDNFLNDPSINIHFCLNWANENWTRRWDGQEKDVLIAQNYTPEDDIEIMKDILKYFKDPRYIRVDGRPMLLVYRADLLPNMSETIKRWHKVCKENGEAVPYMVMCQSFANFDPTQYGFDAAVQFPPHAPWTINNPQSAYQQTNVKNIVQNFSGNIFSYSTLIKSCISGLSNNFINYPCIVPSWDNTPRRLNKSNLFVGSTPSLYKKWLNQLCLYIKEHNSKNNRFIFINAWNEWGEGAHLEPSKDYGFAYLNATAEILSNNNHINFNIYDNGNTWNVLNINQYIKRDIELKIAIHIHLYYIELTDEFIYYLNRINIKFDLYISIPHGVSSDNIKEKFKHSLKYANKIEVVSVQNKGADVAPFLCVFGTTLIKYDLICHIHTKKSLSWNNFGDEWRKYLLNNLLPDNNRIINMLYCLYYNKNIKLIYPEHFEKIKKHLIWNINYKKTNELASSIGIHLPIENNDYIDFPSGFMFWCKPIVINKLLELKLNYDNFEDVTGKDGSVAHAIERLMGFIVDTTEKRHIVLDNNKREI